ncbi:MAG: hypothetical protein ACP5O6_10960 [Candidatus Baltobacteraceae bacterium]
MGCLADLLAEHRKVVTTMGRGGHCVAEIDTSYAGGSLLLFFNEGLPHRPGISVLTSIALNYPTSPNAVSAVIHQAGSPTITDGKKPWVVAMWCFGFTCHDMNKVLRDPKRGPILLVHQGGGFTLEDGGAENRYESLLNAALAKHGITINNN